MATIQYNKKTFNNLTAEASLAVQDIRNCCADAYIRKGMITDICIPFVYVKVSTDGMWVVSQKSIFKLPRKILKTTYIIGKKPAESVSEVVFSKK